MTLAVLSTLKLSAQQEPMYTQYMFNTLSVNPAYAGSANALNILALSRHQWVGLEGAPNTQTLVIQSPIKIYNLGLGLTALRDKIGPTIQNAFYLDLSYSLRLSKNSRLATGLKVGTSVFNVDLNSLSPSSSTDNLFQNNVTSGWRPNVGFGLYYKYTNKFYAGLSVPKVLENKIDNNPFSTQQKRHLFAIAGMALPISNFIVFKPTMLAKVITGAPAEFDLTANFLFINKLWAGINYRTGDSFGLLFQYQISEQLKAGYAHDFTSTNLRKYSAGTHEIMIQYEFNYKDNKVESPRYF